MSKAIDEQVHDHDTKMATAWKAYSCERDECLSEIDPTNEDDQMTANEYAWCEICAAWGNNATTNVSDAWCIAEVVRYATDGFIESDEITREMVDWAIEGARMAGLAFCNAFWDR